MNRFGRRSLVLATSAFATLSAPAIHAQSRGALRVGLGPQQPTQADTRRVWEPLYRLVAERLGLSLTLNVANDWAGISVALQNEQIDIAQMGPWGYILAHVNGGSRIVNTMLVNGIPTWLEQCAFP
jgi:phosphonate transport system substrate-binding protein